MGGGEFFSGRNFFSSSNSLYEYFLGHSLNIFLGLINSLINFFHLIFPCANIFLFFFLRSVLKGQTVKKVIGGRGIFEPGEFFFVIKFLV